MKQKAKTTKEHQPSPIKQKNALESENSEDIINLILRDHVPLKDLIQILKDSETEREQKQGAFEEFALLLTNHAKSEEQSLYVEMKEHKDLRVESFEGDTEHAIADQLVQEINATPDDDEWTAKVKVLAESVEHHIEEEEEEMLVEVEEKLDRKTRMAIGAEYIRLKKEYDSLSFQTH